jgi:chromo domain-containing protein 1
MQSRNLAERAPDLNALGGLYDPSNPSKLKPLHPSDIVRQNPNNARGEDDQTRSMEIQSPMEDIQSVEPRPARPLWVGPRPDYKIRDGFNAICAFFYTTAQCHMGDTCRYRHVDREDLPVAPKPWDGPCMHFLSPQGCVKGDRCTWAHPEGMTRDTPIKVNYTKWNPTSGTNEPTTFNAICYFWKNMGSCNKGSACTFAHSNDDRLPVANPPKARNTIPTVSGHGSLQNDQLMSNDDSSLTPAESRPNEIQSEVPALKFPVLSKPEVVRKSVSFANEPPSTKGSVSSTRPIWTKENGNNAVCYFYASNNFCSSQHCTYHHTWDGNLPVAPRPFSTGATVSKRPTWKQTDGYNAICNMWYNVKECNLGIGCAYQHTEDEGLPIGPLRQDTFKDGPFYLKAGPDWGKICWQPETIPTLKKDKRCRDWWNGSCEWGEKCVFQHPLPELPLRLQFPAPFPDQSSRASNTVDSAAAIDDLPQFTTQIIDSPTSDLPAPLADQQQQPLLIVRNNTADELKKGTATLPPVSGAPKHKISVAAYTQSKKIEAAESRAIEAYFGPDQSQSIVLDFGKIDNVDLEKPCAKLFSRLPNLYFNQQCIAQDFKAQRSKLQDSVCWQGELNSDPSGMDLFNKLTKQLRLQVGGLISVKSNLVVLVHPVMDEWEYLGTPKTTANSPMRYLVFTTKPRIHLAELTKPSPDRIDTSRLSSRRQLFAKFHNISFTSLLPHPRRTTDTHHFFFLFAPSYKTTPGLLASWIRSYHNWKTKIYTGENPEAWDYFVNCPKVQSCIVLIHKTQVLNITNLPGLMKLLVEMPNKRTTFWYINDTPDEWPLYPLPSPYIPGGINATQLFPMGGAIFLAPSFLVAEPVKAFQLLEWFQKKYRNAPAGIYKLFCCQKIGEYLLELAIDKFKEREVFLKKCDRMPTKDAKEAELGLTYIDCEHRFKCHTIICEMLEDPFYCPIVQAPKFIDQDNEEGLAWEFEGYAVLRFHKFKKFTTIGTDHESSKKAFRWRNLSSYKTDANHTPGELSPRKVLENTSLDSAQSFASSVRLQAGELEPYVGSKDATSPQKPTTSHSDDGSAQTDNNSNYDHDNDDMDVDAQVSEHLAKMRAEVNHPYPLVPQDVQNLYGGGPCYQNSPSQLASFVDSRPPSSNSGIISSTSSRSGVAMGRTGSRTVSSSLRPRGPGRLENNIKPGYVPSEDREVYRPPQSGESSRPTSIQPTSADLVVGVPKTPKDGLVDETGGNIEDDSLEFEELRFEATTSWFERLKAADQLEGGGAWEHHFIGGYKKCFLHLKVNAL